MKINTKYFFLLIFMLLSYGSIYGCGGAYFNEDAKFFSNQFKKVSTDPISYVNICTDFFTKEEYIKSLSYIYCSRTDTIPIFVTKKYFSDCSLLFPIDYVYNCQQQNKE